MIEIDACSTDMNRNSIGNAWGGCYNRYGKRMLDLFLACVLILPLFPVYLLISLFVVVESGFPVFYRAKRGGLHGKPFRIFKFRSMVRNADQLGGGTTALHDPRITRVGHFLRKTKLDEIPQLFNILRGEMSFIGPRPELLRYTEQYDESEQVILKVRPGISDYSSITFINLDEIVGSGDADEVYERVVLKEKNRLRIQYAKTVSLKTDVSLFFQTIGQVFRKIGRVVTNRQN